MKTILAGVVMTLLYGIYFHICWQGVVALTILTALGMIYLKCFLWQEQRKKEDFLELTEYMQGIGMSFLLAGTEYPALKETILLFPDCRMRTVLKQAAVYMEGNRDGTAGEAGFRYIEENYPCKKMCTLHSYMLTAAKVGGEFQNGMRLLLKNLELWKSRQLLAYEELKRDKQKIMISLVMTIVLCGYVSSLAAKQVDITGYALYQIGMILFWCTCVVIYIVGQRAGSMDWFEEKVRYTDAEIQKKHDKFRKEQSHHKIGYKARKNILQKEFMNAFPEWILEVALRMENKNVEVALEESYTKASVIIKPYLSHLLRELKKFPGEGEPYFQFAQDFHIPEVTNSMKLLYGMSKGAIDGGGEHVHELVERNYQLERQAGDYRLEKKRGTLYAFTLIPSLLGAGCLILNMSLLLIGFMGNLKV